MTSERSSHRVPNVRQRRDTAGGTCDDGDDGRLDGLHDVGRDPDRTGAAARGFESSVEVEAGLGDGLRVIGLHGVKKLI